MTLHYAEPEPLKSLRNPWARRAMFVVRGAFIALVTGVVLAMLAGMCTLLGGMFGAWYIFVIGLLAIVAFAQMRAALHRRRVAGVLACCARGMRLRLPLDVFLRAAAESEQGVLRRRLATVARRVSAGHRAERAIVDSLPELDERQSRLIMDAGASGALVQELDRLYEEQASSPARPAEDVHGRLIYCSVGLLTAGIVSTLFLVFVLPKYKQIAIDFGMRPVRTSLEDFSAALVVVSGLAACVLLYYVGGSVATLTRLRRTAAGRRMWTRFVPVFGRGARDLALADFYLAAARAIEAGQPITSLAVAASPSLRGAAAGGEDLLAELASGRPAARSSLPAQDLAVMSTARGTGGLAQALRFLAGARLRSREASARWVAAAFSMAATLALAAMTCELMRAVWGPMLAMLEVVGDHALGRHR